MRISVCLVVYSYEDKICDPSSETLYKPLVNDLVAYLNVKQGNTYAYHFNSTGPTLQLLI